MSLTPRIPPMRQVWHRSNAPPSLRPLPVVVSADAGRGRTVLTLFPARPAGPREILALVPAEESGPDV